MLAAADCSIHILDSFIFIDSKIAISFVSTCQLNLRYSSGFSLLFSLPVALRIRMWNRIRCFAELFCSQQLALSNLSYFSI